MAPEFRKCDAKNRSTSTASYRGGLRFVYLRRYLRGVAGHTAEVEQGGGSRGREKVTVGQGGVGRG